MEALVNLLCKVVQNTSVKSDCIFAIWLFQQIASWPGALQDHIDMVRREARTYKGRRRECQRMRKHSEHRTTSGTIDKTYGSLLL